MAFDPTIKSTERESDVSHRLDDEYFPSKEVSLLVVPQFTWVGARSDADVTEGTLYLNSIRPSLPPEVALNAAMQHLVSEVVSEFLRLGRDVGIDLRNRVPPLDHFHIFDKEGYDIIRENYGLSAQSVGVHSTSGHMMVQADVNSLANTLGTLNHELLHVGGFRSISLEYDGNRVKVNRLREGYDRSQSDDWLMFNESVTELLNCYLISEYWRDNPLLNRHSGEYTDVGYRPMVELTTQILSQMERDLGVPRAELIQVMVFDYFTGGDVLTELIEDIFPSAGVNALKRLDFSSIDECRRDLGLVIARKE